MFQEDGLAALRSLLPPPERRGLVLIDPPYEEKGELERIADALEGALRRFGSGAYLVWYPVKDLSQPNAFFRRIEALNLRNALRIELHVRAPVDPGTLNGCGLLAINPPWTISGQLSVLLPFLAERLAQGQGAGWRVA